MFRVDRFDKSDKHDWLCLWDMADPWCRENKRPDIPESNWRDLMSSHKSLSGFALRADNRLTGYGLYFFCPSIRNVRDECEVRDLYIHPDFRRKGGGTLLMNAIHEAAENYDAGRVYWSCNAAREDSLAFLSRFGAEEKTERTYYQWLNTALKA